MVSRALMNHGGEAFFRGMGTRQHSDAAVNSRRRGGREEFHVGRTWPERGLEGGLRLSKADVSPVLEPNDPTLGRFPNQNIDH
jgi:hypothetical protein